MTLFDECGEQFLHRHTLGHIVDLLKDFVDRRRLPEKAFGVYVTDDPVDVLLINRQPREMRIDKARGELPDRIGPVDRLDIDPRHHAVAHEQPGKVERILEQADIFLVIVLFVALGCLVDQVCQIDPVEGLRPPPRIDRQPENTQDQRRNESGDTRQRIKQQVKQENRHGEGTVVQIGIEPHDGFGDVLRGKNDDNRRKDRLKQERPAGKQPPPRERKQRLDQQAHLQRIDHQCDVVADENRRNVLPRMT